MKIDTDFTIFRTPDKNYSWTIPTHWSEYDDGEDSTYAFFNTAQWTGNLRITPVILKENPQVKNIGVTRLIGEEIENNKGAYKPQLGKYDCACYKTETSEPDQVIYYWTTGRENTLLICSFTIDKEQENSKLNENELEVVRQIITSINIKSTASAGANL